MMSDLVDRLRWGFGEHRNSDRLMNEAAEEIERLRAIIQNVGLAVGIDADKVPILDSAERT